MLTVCRRGRYCAGATCWRSSSSLRIRLTRLRLGAALREGAWRIALVGVSLGAAQTLCYFQSLRRLDTGIAVLLFYTFPVVTLGVERLFFKERVAPTALVCVIVILAGAALIGRLARRRAVARGVAAEERAGLAVARLFGDRSRRRRRNVAILQHAAAGSRD